MSLTTLLNNNKEKIYNLYNITNEDITILFKHIILASGENLAVHLVSKFKGYDKNPILFIESLDCNIKKFLFQWSGLYSETCHDFFVWFNKQHNQGLSLDDYCNYETVLSTYYSKSLAEKEFITNKYLLEH